MSTTALYIALASDQGGTYRAAFPDVPECTVEADSLSALLARAREALAGCLRRRGDAGEAWPDPTPLEQLPRGDSIPLLVDVPVDDRPVRVNISLSERLLERLDAAAEASAMTRSGFIAQSVRARLDGGAGAGDFEAASRRLQDELRAIGRRINDSLGPGSAFSRRMSELDEHLYEGVRRAADNVSAAMARRRESARQARSNEAERRPGASADEATATEAGEAR